MLNDSYLIEFISVPEMVEVLHKVNPGIYGISTGSSYISMVAENHTIFVLASQGSCNGKWNTDNCSDHITLHIYTKGIKQGAYVMSLQHMKLTTVALRDHLEKTLCAINAKVEREHRQSARDFDSRTQQQIQENIAIARRTQWIDAPL
jgi:hypothetical protein